MRSAERERVERKHEEAVSRGAMRWGDVASCGLPHGWRIATPHVEHAEGRGIYVKIERTV